MNQLDPYLLPPEGTPPQPATTGQNWTHKKRPPLASELQRTDTKKEKSLSVLLYREREKKTMGKLTDTNIMIALGFFEAYLKSGETFNIPEEFDSPEAQAFVAGMIARKRYVLEGVKKDVR